MGRWAGTSSGLPPHHRVTLTKLSSGKAWRAACSAARRESDRKVHDPVRRRYTDRVSPARRFLGYVRPYAPRYAAGVLCLAAATGLSLAIPWQVKLAVDALRAGTGTRVVAVYAAAILALAPLKDAIDPASVVVDAKSGVSGAGRQLQESSHAGFVLENLSPYKVGAHQHAPEIAQALGFPVCFVPHLLPVRRGLLATCYVQPDGDLRLLLEDAYADSDVVRVLPEGVVPELARVQHTDGAEIAVFEDRATSHAVVICALDNLGKGAAGQALQNANLALGFEQTLGLRLAGVLV